MQRALGAEPLITSYRGLVCDLDGVVYRGPVAVPGAVETLNRITADGVPVVFATNNASRPPDDVATHLGELGIEPSGWSVVTSSQAGAAYLSGRLAPRTPVLAVGGPGVAEALAEAGLAPVRVAALNGTPVAAVLQGLGVDVTWHELAEVGFLVQRGVTWVATNLDPMLPTARGPAPGNGALVAAVQQATDARPHVVGKPGPALFELARQRLGVTAAGTIACGDRLDTDIAGANAAGVDSLLVLSGAARLQDLACAGADERPTYVARDLTGLLEPARRLRPAADDRVEITRDGRVDVEADCSLQDLVGAAWAARDAGSELGADAGQWRDLEARFGLSGP